MADGAPEQPTFYTADARRRIDASVRDFEGSGTGVVGHVLGRLVRAAFQIKLGKTDGAITKGTSGTVSEYKGTTAGSESDTTVNHTVYCRFGDVASGKWVLYFRFLGHWELLMAECA